MACAPLTASSISGPNCPELLQLLFACERLGAIFVPLNVRMPAAELQVFVKATRPRLLVAEVGFREIALDSAGDLGAERVKTFQLGGELAHFAGAAERATAVSGADATAPALILFTSGTTGRAKGATSRTRTSRSTRSMCSPLSA